MADGIFTSRYTGSGHTWWTFSSVSHSLFIGLIWVFLIDWHGIMERNRKCFCSLKRVMVTARLPAIEVITTYLNNKTPFKLNGSTTA